MPSRVLIIEDDPLVRDCVVLVLEAEGLDVACARDGEEGLRVMRRFAPDLVVSDLNMPDVDGLEVIDRVRAQAGARPVPFVFITADHQPDTQQRCLDRGAAFLRKPFDPDELVALVLRLL